MLVSALTAWKLVLTAGLLVTLVLSARARAPRRALARADMSRLVLGALALYAAGALAWLTGHLALAVVVYAAGIMTAALAAWLSRGHDPGEPPDEGEPDGAQPPPDPDGFSFDWAAFERDLRAYTERTPAYTERKRARAGVCN